MLQGSTRHRLKPAGTAFDRRLMMPTSKPPRILLGHEIDASATGTPEGAAAAAEARLPDALPDGDTAADQRLALVDPAVAFMPALSAPDGVRDHIAPDLPAAPLPDRVPEPAAVMPGAPAFASALPGFGGPLAMGEAGRLWGAFAYRQMARALEGIVEGTRCRTPGDVMGLHQRLVQETLQDCTTFGIDLATVPMRSMTAPTTVCAPVPSAA